MSHKNILALSPILPLATDLEDYTATLSFLEKRHRISWHDPLSLMNNSTIDVFQNNWQVYFENHKSIFDGFIGFSMGAILLQTLLKQLQNNPYKILLIAPPSHLDKSLTNKLQSVLSLLQQNHTIQALEKLYQYVNPLQEQSFNYTAEELVTINSRVSFGLSYVLHYASKPLLSTKTTPYHQLVGKNSQLVTEHNLIKNSNIHTYVIPDAGMRLLQDNPQLTQRIIWDYFYD